jgi:hypothetical protein
MIDPRRLALYASSGSRGMACLLRAAAAAVVLACCTPAGADEGPQGCVSVQDAGVAGPDFKCLNAELAAVVDDQAARNVELQRVVAGTAPASAPAMGLYNQAATRERLGSSFGHSVVPQRPPQVYSNPLISGHH